MFFAGTTAAQLGAEMQTSRNFLSVPRGRRGESALGKDKFKIAEPKLLFHNLFLLYFCLFLRCYRAYGLGQLECLNKFRREAGYSFHLPRVIY